MEKGRKEGGMNGDLYEWEGIAGERDGERREGEERQEVWGRIGKLMVSI